MNSFNGGFRLQTKKFKVEKIKFLHDFYIPSYLNAKHIYSLSAHISFSDSNFENAIKVSIYSYISNIITLKIFSAFYGEAQIFSAQFIKNS